MKYRRALAAVAVAVSVTLLSLSAGLVINEVSADREWPGWLNVLRDHPWQSLTVLAVATVMLTIAARPTDSQATGAARRLAQTRAIADQLATTLQRQWVKEAGRRNLNDPYALNVKWRAADPDLVEDWQSLTRLASTGVGWPIADRSKWATSPSELAGSDNDLLYVLDKIPTGRLLVLGEPGAGKTVLLVRLLLDFLVRRQPGQPVPILVPLASWNPVEQDLLTWIERWMITDQPALGSPVSDGTQRTKARGLLDARLIVMLLDGLDEIPEGIRDAAISRINEAVEPGVRIIVASRKDDYRAAMRRPQQMEVILTGTAGIQLEPLDPLIAIEYLRRSGGGTAGASRWDEVSEVIQCEGRSPVAEALTTPLMVAMARAIYNPKPHEQISSIPRKPGELLSASIAVSRKVVEQHLFDAFIPAAYRDKKHKQMLKIHRWLVFLAKDLEIRQKGATDVAWWQLSEIPPRLLNGLVVGVLSAAVAIVTIPFVGLGIGLSTSILAGLWVRRQQRPRRASLTRGMIGGLLGGMAGALVCLIILSLTEETLNLTAILSSGLGTGIVVSILGRFGPGFAGGFSGAVVCDLYEGASYFENLRGIADSVGGRSLLNGLGFGLAAAVAAGVVNRRTPARGIKWSNLGFLYGLTIGVTFGSLIWLQLGSPSGIIVTVVSTITGSLAGGLLASPPSDLSTAVSPRAVLARDRLTFVVSFLGLGLPLGISTGIAVGFNPVVADEIPHGLVPGVAVGATNLLVEGLCLAFLQATWGSFLIATVWLALAKRLPLRALNFLEDAHSRGVLRQVGPVYQFRHVDLQRRLAEG